MPLDQLGALSPSNGQASWPASAARVRLRAGLPRVARIAGFATLALVCLMGGTGCVSTAYQRVPQESPPAVPLELETTNDALTLTLDTVIVYNGPGSWKRNAYWDEYQLTLENHTAAPVLIQSASLVDFLGLDVAPGNHPWQIEKASRRSLAVFSNNRRRVFVGVALMGTGQGLAVAYTGSILTASGSSAALGLGAAALVVGPPAWFAGTTVRNSIARHDLKREFHRRRLALPLTLAPGEVRRGSLFFPVSPGPQRMILACGRDGLDTALTLDLAALGGLHILRQPGPEPQAVPPASD